MAEILLSLTIIGVVAAITLPSLTGNINERTWNTQRKALYARMSQAVSLMPALNGYGVLEEGDPNNVAEVFLTNGLSKVLKINNICDSEHLSDCGIPNKIMNREAGEAFSVFPKTLVTYNDMFSGSVSVNGKITSYNQIDTKAAAFETANGEAIVTYYNPNCKGATDTISDYKVQPLMCANFIYDLNGKKGPNTVGKDVGFMSVLYSSDSVVVAPYVLGVYPTLVSYNSAISFCKNTDDEARIPTKDELASIFYNRILVGDSFASQPTSFWSGSTISVGAINAWLQEPYGGTMWHTPRDENAFYLCVKRN